MSPLIFYNKKADVIAENERKNIAIELLMEIKARLAINADKAHDWKNLQESNRKEIRIIASEKAEGLPDVPEDIGNNTMSTIPQPSTKEETNSRLMTEEETLSRDHEVHLPGSVT